MSDHAIIDKAQGYILQRRDKPISKGVLDRWRGLTIDERVDLAFLESQGFDPDEARALAMAGSGGRIKKKDYKDAYLAAGKDWLPDWQHDELHRRARASAGGTQAGRNRKARVDATKADKLEHINWLQSEIKRLGEEVDKAGPLMSETHVDVPLTAPKKKKNRVKALFDRATTKSSVDAMIDAAFAPVTKTHVVPTTGNMDDPSDPPGQGKYLDAHRLLRGMDHEMLQGADGSGDARKKASLALAQSMGAYDSAFPNSDLRHVGGIDIDLACGSAREAGYLGLDIYPFDYGVAVHDLSLGIPFTSASVRSVRLCNALDSLTDYTDDPTPLVREIERVLTLGGRLYYQGPQSLADLVDMPAAVPGLTLLPDESQDATGVVTEVYGRSPVRVPAVFGADADMLGHTEMTPLDLLMARMAYGDVPSDSMVMANLVASSAPDGITKSAVEVEQNCRVIKRDKYQQIILGVVLVPDVVDSQGDVMSAEEIEKTAHQFLVDARVVGSEHEGPMKGSSVVESYIAPTDLQFDGGPYGPQDVPKGSWVLGVHVGDPKEFEKVLDGDYTGFSVGGWGERAKI